jgi:hypothetical protein
MTECENQLQWEREKLDRLVDEALQSGTPLSETYEIMDQCRKVKRMAGEAKKALRSDAVRAQSRKVDELIEKVEEGEEGGR